MRFEAGQTFIYDNIHYHILAGNRCPGDLVIEFSVDGYNWKRPTITHSLILFCFKWQVEENNYGKEGKIKRGQGGEYLIGSLRRAIKWGWQDEAKHIEAEANGVRQGRKIDNNGQFGFNV